jgi:L-alanine-DL-glutamate epimerase-like enolase superfamily enzyme
MSHFELSFRQIDLPLKHTFTISRGSRNFAKNVIIRIKADDIEGWGEAAPNHRYNETPESVINFLQKLELSRISNPYDIQAILDYLSELEPGEFAAKAGLEMAFQDWIGKKLNLPLYKLWNAPSNTGPQSSVTIGISELDMIEEKIREFEQYPIYKVKLGTDYDREIINKIRLITDKQLWVDANEGWKSFDQAKRMIEFLRDKNIGMIEQPMPASKIDDIAELRTLSKIPFMADEGFTGKEKLNDIAEAYDGINIKLMKVGSMRKALQLIAQARKSGLKIMIGCMLESGMANTAAAILSLWADYADIDGPMLLADNPFEGFKLDKKDRVKVNDMPGLGVKMVNSSLML